MTTATENTQDYASNSDGLLPRDSAKGVVAQADNVAADDDISYTEEQVTRVRWKIDVCVMPLMTLIYCESLLIDCRETPLTVPNSVCVY